MTVPNYLTSFWEWDKNYDLSDVHDFVLDDFGSVSDAQLFWTEHVPHVYQTLHDFNISNK